MSYLELATYEKEKSCVLNEISDMILIPIMLKI
jgi:hypothetical protein